MHSQEWIDRTRNQSVFPLARSSTAIKPHYSVVIVGSGHAGAAAAARIAHSGQSVCVLECGREILPGDYPLNEWQLQSEIQFDDGHLHFGSPQALFGFHVGDGINALVGHGLGGTSVINAGVCVRPHAEVFRDPVWPEELRERDALNRHFMLAERMLGATPFPASIPAPCKLQLLQAAARSIGESVIRPPIAVSFEDGVNNAGVAQPACTLCGDCCSGCNYGAKNSVLMNYLPEARRDGAEIFVGVKVTHVEQLNRCWHVHCVRLDEAASSPERDFVVSADVTILAAGSLGSTEILLRSRAASATGGDVAPSRLLGKRFSGNADVLGFGYDCSEKVMGVGAGASSPLAAGSPGPCITGLIDIRNENDLTDSRKIEEGVVPGALKRWLAWVLAGAARSLGQGRSPTASQEFASFIEGPYVGSVSRTFTLLSMGHDSSAGELALGANGRLQLRWPDAARERGIIETQGIFRRLIEALGGTTLLSPQIPIPLINRTIAPLITVQPLGGCAMGDSAEHGVVNHKGQVFAGATGTEVHQGLYVCDGAILPRSIGSNPLLTITALAERIAELLIQDRGWMKGATPKPQVHGENAHAASRPGLRFSERMSGYYEEGLDPSDELPQLGWRRLAATRDPNERDGVNATLLLVVSSSDIEATLKSDSHVFRVDGTVELPSLSVLPLEVSAGSFRIFSADSEQPHLRRMEYELHLHAVSGEDFFLFGEKLLRDDARFAIWTETTALRFWVYRGLNRSGTPLGGGFLRIRAADFIRQLQTMTITNAVHESDRLKWIARFGRFFAGNLFRTYGPVFAEKPLLDNAYRPRPRRKLRAPLPEVHDVVTQDCTTVRLTRYRAGSKGPVIIAPGFGVTAASYAIDTIETNLVEHLAERHYDVWLFDYRASPTLVSARTEFSLDDIARQDWPSAIRHVREATNTDVQVIAHCIGSMTLLMALLDGATGVRSVVCSQLALHAYGWWANQLAAGFDVATGLRRIGIRTPDIHYHERLLDYTDTLLRVAPVPEGEECESRTCRRIFSLFGPSYNHANLNQATHDAIAEMFGVTSITAFEHLSRIVRHGHAVDCRGGNSYICANRLNRLALPILFLAGAENREFTPRSSEKTWELLASANDFESFERLHSADSNAMSPGSPKAPLYERRVLEGYGHLDCFIGREAHRDVFPVINAFLARH